MTDTNHSPLPLSVDYSENGKVAYINDAHGNRITPKAWHTDSHNGHEFAKLAVLAINSHASQKERIEELEKFIEEMHSVFSEQASGLSNNFYFRELSDLFETVSVECRKTLSKGGE